SRPASAALTLPAGRTATLVAPHAGGTRLWLAQLGAGEPIHEYLWRYGRPIRYRYVSCDWPLDDYQTAFATEAGSAEMPSAARPLTPELVTRLIAGGVQVAPVTLHAGVSSPERGEGPQAERYSVPAATARLVNLAHQSGGLVIAVGTTVARALETAAGLDGRVTASAGWTQLVITPERGMYTLDGLLTGWHEPAASHLQMLEAAAGPELVRAAYDAAVDGSYLWHEFGDSQLILPAARASATPRPVTPPRERASRPGRAARRRLESRPR
ncbi:MAG: hypothetical protein GEU88_16110, partial [Solirubrobacterales bacterium]|nr:hypothetical protein [Solirubrobacterales bacterium]